MNEQSGKETMRLEALVLTACVSRVLDLTPHPTRAGSKKSAAPLKLVKGVYNSCRRSRKL